MLRKTLVLACAVIGLTSLAAQAAAQGPIDRRTYFTLSGSFEIPGATLPAGKYLFRLPSPGTSHDVVQVLSADSKKVYGTFFSIPTERATPASDSELRFMETAAGAPPPIRAWWHGGERTGREFVYPRTQARRLAAAGKSSVLTTKADTSKASETDTSDLARVTAEGADKGVADDSASTSIGPIGRGEIVAEAGPIEQGRVASNRSELPRTASSTPIVGLAGMFAFFTAGALWILRRRSF